MKIKRILFIIMISTAITFFLGSNIEASIYEEDPGPMEVEDEQGL